MFAPRGMQHPAFSWDGNDGKRWAWCGKCGKMRHLKALVWCDIKEHYMCGVVRHECWQDERRLAAMAGKGTVAATLDRRSNSGPGTAGRRSRARNWEAFTNDWDDDDEDANEASITEIQASITELQICGKDMGGKGTDKGYNAKAKALPPPIPSSYSSKGGGKSMGPATDSGSSMGSYTVAATRTGRWGNTG